MAFVRSHNVKKIPLPSFFCVIRFLHCRLYLCCLRCWIQTQHQPISSHGNLDDHERGTKERICSRGRERSPRVSSGCGAGLPRRIHAYVEADRRPLWGCSQLRHRGAGDHRERRMHSPNGNLLRRHGRTPSFQRVVPDTAQSWRRLALFREHPRIRFSLFRPRVRGYFTGSGPVLAILIDRRRVLILTAAIIGVLSTTLSANWTGLWALVPLLWMEADSRLTAFFMSCAFYLAMSRGIVPGAYVFFRDGSFIRAITLWVTSAIVLAAPWGIFWPSSSDTVIRKAIKTIAVLCASIPPPLGLIGWGNPLTITGLFLPKTGWYGLLLVIGFYVTAKMHRKWRIFMALLIVFTIPFCRIEDRSLRIMQGVNTTFGRLASGSGDFDAQYERERQVFRLLCKMRSNGEFNANIIVLPETLIGRMNPTTQRRWEEFFQSMSGLTFVAGAEIPQGRKYDNVMIAFEGDGQNQKAAQRFPVPFSMYRPFSGSGANAFLFSLGEDATLQIKGLKIGCLVCYEQFLTWPFLSLLSTKPDVIIASANLWWCKDTSLPEIQSNTVALWAALFDLPVVTAINH